MAAFRQESALQLHGNKRHLIPSIAPIDTSWVHPKTCTLSNTRGCYQCANLDQVPAQRKMITTSQYTASNP